MTRKNLIILLIVPVFAFLLILFGMRQNEVPPKKERMPEWAALWESKETNPAHSEAAIIPFAKNFPIAVEKEYPIGTSSEKIVSDCKALDYKFTSEENLPPVSLTKEYPCRYNSCNAVHSLGDSGYSISVLWCEESGKITWLRSRFGQWVD